MLDETSVEGKTITAAMKLAADRSWTEITLRDVALSAGLTLSDLRGRVSSKTDILIGLLKAADGEVLRNAEQVDLSQAPRDRLFEVLMSRFDTLEPYKAGLKSVAQSASFTPIIVRHILASQAWMLTVAGINADGISGGVKTAGLASVYAQTFRTWLADDDLGLARTMAALDRHLRRGERTISSMSEACKCARQARRALGNVLMCAVTGSRRSTQADPSPDGPEHENGERLNV